VADDNEDQEKEAELEGGRMPFLAHLTELRDRVRNAALWFMGAFLVCWYFAKDIFAWLRQPLFDIWVLHTGPGIPPAEDWGPPRLIYTGLTQPFWVDMSIGLWAGVFVASPFIFFELWRFIAPGLYKKERRVTVVFAVFSAVFFVCGALFCFEFALPKLYTFLLSYNSRDLQSLPNIQEYLDLTRDSMLAFGAIFEMPLLIYFLAMVGLVTHRGLWKFSRWWIVLSFIIGAILTPGPDVISQFLMALPMIVLYNVSILFAWRVTLKRERKQKAVEERLAKEEEERKARRAAKRAARMRVDEDDDAVEDEVVTKAPASKGPESKDE
jgi:sec-independent protein translocase protein TatC